MPLVRVTSAPPAFTVAVTLASGTGDPLSSRTKPKKYGPWSPLLSSSSPKLAPPACAGARTANVQTTIKAIRRLARSTVIPGLPCEVTAEQMGDSRDRANRHQPGQTGPQPAAEISRQIAHDESGNGAHNRRGRDPAIPIHRRAGRG